MNHKVFYMSFDASPRLSKNAHEFIDRMLYRQEPGEHIQSLLFDVANEFTYASLYPFFAETLQALQLEAQDLKTVDAAITSIRKSTGFVLGKSVFRLEPSQLRMIAQHLEKIIQPTANSDQPFKPARVVFPVSPQWLERFKSQLATINQPGQTPDHNQLVQLFVQLTDEGIASFYESLLASLNDQPFIQRLADAAIITSRTAFKALFSQVFGHLSASQTKTLMSRFNASLRTDRDLHNNVASYALETA